MTAEGWILGIDEAGRGPVLGPMVVAGLWIPAGQADRLRELGLRDSKTLRAADRERLEAELSALDFPRVRVTFSAAELDAGNLNRLCMSCILDMAERRPPYELQLDAPVPPRGLPNYRTMVRAGLERRGVKVPVLRAENKAEDKFPAVAGASILAKTERDRLLRERAAPWEDRFGPAGSGYPSDPLTRAFLKRCLQDDELPPLVRTRWATIRNLRAELAQGALF